MAGSMEWTRAERGRWSHLELPLAGGCAGSLWAVPSEELRLGGAGGAVGAQGVVVGFQ